MLAMNFAAVKEQVFAALRSALLPDADVGAQFQAAIISALKPDAADSLAAVDGTEPAKPSLPKESKDLLELIVRMFMEELLNRSKKGAETIESVGIPRLLDVVRARVVVWVKRESSQESAT